MRVGLIEPAGKTDAAGHGVDFGDDVSGIGQHQVGPNDHRQLVAELLLTRELDELRRLACVEVARDPRGLFAFDALVIELIARALEDEELVPEPLELRSRTSARSRMARAKGGNPFPRRGPRWEGGADGGEFVASCEHAREACSKRRTLNVERRTSNEDRAEHGGASKFDVRRSTFDVRRLLA